jgi:alpha-galactosidase
MAHPLEIKIAYIGGGSREWARKLMIELALCPDLTGQVALYDIDLESAKLNEQLGTWLQDQPNVVSRWRYITVPTLREALQNANFVVVSIQPGTLEVMAEEIAIAEKYGLFFPVGDTTGAPGLVRGLRAATIYEGFAHAIAEVCPAAWVINYTNPMTICTRTLTRVEPSLKVFGCCHEVFAVQQMLASLASRYHSVSPAREDVLVNVTGINHFTLFDRAHYKEIDLLALLRHHIDQPDVLRTYTQAEVESWQNYFHSPGQVKFNLFKQFGVLPSAGDRHLVEFLPGFIRSPETLFRWGVIRTPVSYRIERWRAAPQKTRDIMGGKESLPLKPTGEDVTAQIKALVGLGDVITNVNLENQGQVANLPLRAVVETNARFSRDSLTPLAAGSLPSSFHSLISQHVNNQELIVEAALTRNKEMAFEAIYNDPTNNLPLDEARRMFDEMLDASKNFLPGF